MQLSQFISSRPWQFLSMRFLLNFTSRFCFSYFPFSSAIFPLLLLECQILLCADLLGHIFSSCGSRAALRSQELSKMCLFPRTVWHVSELEHRRLCSSRKIFADIFAIATRVIRHWVAECGEDVGLCGFLLSAYSVAGTRVYNYVQNLIFHDYWNTFGY